MPLVYLNIGRKFFCNRFFLHIHYIFILFSTIQVLPVSCNNQQYLGKELIALSKKKWQWMADKDADKLAELFHDKSQIVHMGGSWGKEREVEIIRSGGIHYKNAEIHEVSADVMGTTAVVLNHITLLGVVGGNEITNPFMVTEVYVKEADSWKLANFSFVKQLAGNGE